MTFTTMKIHDYKKTQNTNLLSFSGGVKLVVHRIMALPNVIWPWSIFYSKDQLLKKENKKSLGVFYFLKLNNNY
jgi:hypothetical protein